MTGALHPYGELYKLAAAGWEARTEGIGTDRPNRSRPGQLLVMVTDSMVTASLGLPSVVGDGDGVAPVLAPAAAICCRMSRPCVIVPNGV